MIMVIIVFGLPGTGKTYFSEHLAASIDAKHLNTDKIRVQYKKEGKYDKETKQFIYDKLGDKAVSFLQNGENVILDGTFYSQKKRDQIIHKIKSVQDKIYFIEVKANENIVRSRLNQKRNYSEADFKIYKKIERKFEPLLKDHLILWSDNENVDEMIKKTKEYIYE